MFEATRAGQIVWEFTEGLRSPNAAERLPNGNTLIANTFRQEVIEVSKEKKVVWRFAQDVRPFDAERLPSGNTLIADMLHDRVIEVDAAGKIVWQVEKMPSAYDADRLPNGNTLITLRTLNKVVEVDREEGDLAARQAEHPERRGPPAQRQHAGGREQRRARVRPQRQRGVEEGHDVGGGGQPVLTGLAKVADRRRHAPVGCSAAEPSSVARSGAERQCSWEADQARVDMTAASMRW